MIILDTDHFTVLRYADDFRYPILTQRLLASEDQRIVTTVITVEEQLRGWLAPQLWPKDDSTASSYLFASWSPRLK